MVKYIRKKEVLRKFDDILDVLINEPNEFYSMEEIIESIKILREEIEKM